MGSHFDAATTIEDVAEAYRLFLGREPESRAAMEHHLAAHPDLRGLIRTFIGSPEFRTRRLPLAGTPDWRSRVELMLKSIPVPPGGELPARCWRDQLGVLTSFDAHAGNEAATLDYIAHVELEWFALLSTLLEARDRFTFVELGAGYGTWLARAGLGWKCLHAGAPATLVGVEGEPTHFRQMQLHAALNRLEQFADVRLLHGAVGASDGEIEFEVAADPRSSWGTRRAVETDISSLARSANTGTIRVPQWSLSTVLRDLATVDLMHVDIQGDEFDVLRAARSSFPAQVDRLIIGTHARRIEGDLMEMLPPLGYRLLAEQSCRYSLLYPTPLLVEDGAQFWVHRRLAPAALQ